MSDLYWHERERLSREGTLGDMTEDATHDLRVGLSTLLREFRRHGDRLYEKTLVRIAMTSAQALARTSDSTDPATRLTHWIQHCPMDLLLTTLEIVAQEEPRLLRIRSSGGSTIALRTLPEEINRLFARHRFNFEMTEEGDIQHVGSPALYEEIVRPALLARADPRLTDAEDHYQEALGEYRTGEARKAIHSAQLSIESALKAYGYAGGGLDALAEDFRRRSGERGYVTGLAQQLEGLMKDLNGLRNDLGGHAAEPGVARVPDQYALLAIHLAGALIVFLSSTDPVSTPATG